MESISIETSVTATDTKDIELLGSSSDLLKTTDVKGDSLLDAIKAGNLKLTQKLVNEGHEVTEEE